VGLVGGAERGHTKRQSPPTAAGSSKPSNGTIISIDTQYEGKICTGMYTKLTPSEDARALALMDPFFMETTWKELPLGLCTGLGHTLRNFACIVC
jgi:hypothetical protein